MCTTPKFKTCMAACLALAAVALSACGSAQIPSSQSTSGQGEFEARANAVCVKNNSRAEQLVRQYPQVFTPNSTPTPSEATIAYPKLDAIEGKIESELAAITPPAQAQSEYSKLLEIVREGHSRVSALVEAARAGDQEHLTALEHELNTSAIGEKAKAYETNLGLTTCVQETTG